MAAKALDHTRGHDDKLKYAWSMDLVWIEHVEEIVDVKVDLFHVLNIPSRRSDLITVEHAGQTRSERGSCRRVIGLGKGIKWPKRIKRPSRRTTQQTVALPFDMMPKVKFEILT